MTKPFNEYPESVRHAWAAHESFRRLGFETDDIYVLLAVSAQSRKWALHTVLKTQGREFAVVCGSPYESKEAAMVDFIAFRDEFTTRLNEHEFPDDDLSATLLEALGQWGGGTALVTGLLGKGFHLPRCSTHRIEQP